MRRQRSPKIAMSAVRRTMPGDVRPEHIAHRRSLTDLRDDVTTVTSSGNEVPTATTVRPTTIQGTPKRAANPTAPSPSNFLPATTMPAARRNCTMVPGFVCNHGRGMNGKGMAGQYSSSHSAAVHSLAIFRHRKLNGKLTLRREQAGPM